MNTEKKAWGTTRDGNTAHRYLLKNKNGMELELSDFGALILSILIPNKEGNKTDVALGYDTVEEYYNISCELGAFVGRNCNRIANGEVTLDGVKYKLDQNNHGNNLHSGYDRSHCKLYAAAVGEEEGAAWVEFSRLSPHLEQGFPGNLKQKIRYTLTDSNQIRIAYDMVSDMSTVINPTNHCFFNLDGHKSGKILSHKLTVNTDSFTPTDENLLPTGDIAGVENTPMDFRLSCKIGQRIDLDYEPLNYAGGYDHNYAFPHDKRMKKMATLESSRGDIRMNVYSDLCGLQVYSGNFIDNVKGKEGALYQKRDAICLETQFYPNSCNEKRFPGCIFKAGEKYVSETVYEFEF